MGTSSVGYRFYPIEEELVGYFLKNKVMGKPLTGVAREFIIERDLYGDGATPWELLGEDLPWQILVGPSCEIQSQKLLYVFTKLSTVGKNVKNKQITRVAGCGSWHSNKAEEEDVRDDYGKGKVIGISKNFTYVSKEESVGQWTMYEYSIDSAANGLPPGINSENYVICRIMKDESKSSKDGKFVSRKRPNSRLNEVEGGRLMKKVWERRGNRLVRQQE